MQSKTYTVEWVKDFETQDEHKAIRKASFVALETGQPIRVYLNGSRCHKVTPTGIKDVEVTKDVQPTRVVNKYHHLLKYNSTNFKKLSF